MPVRWGQRPSCLPAPPLGSLPEGLEGSRWKGPDLQRCPLFYRMRAAVGLPLKAGLRCALSLCRTTHKGQSPGLQAPHAAASAGSQAPPRAGEVVGLFSNTGSEEL